MALLDQQAQTLQKDFPENTEFKLAALARIDADRKKINAMQDKLNQVCW